MSLVDLTQQDYRIPYEGVVFRRMHIMSLCLTSVTSCHTVVIIMYLLLLCMKASHKLFFSRQQSSSFG
ncbi:Potassium voltage-gated channel subfamily C member 2 [Schistosoma japonicum]|nr:Potassium voltage-gated channel subfamily C member 2 [Schistosoma japonicum]